MNRGKVGEERGGKETDRCPLTAHLSGGVRSRVTRRLTYVNDFVSGEFTIQICTFDINVMQLHV
jgi:hypothetical protein